MHYEGNNITSYFAVHAHFWKKKRKKKKKRTEIQKQFQSSVCAIVHNCFKIESNFFMGQIFRL